MFVLSKTDSRRFESFMEIKKKKKIQTNKEILSQLHVML